MTEDNLTRARREFDEATALALAGDTGALDRLPELGRALLELSRAVNVPPLCLPVSPPDTIRETRTALGLSGARFAAALGFSHGRSVFGWEAGQYPVPAHVLRWCRAVAEVPGLGAWLVARADEARPLIRKRRPGSAPTGRVPGRQRREEADPGSAPRTGGQFGAKVEDVG